MALGVNLATVPVTGNYVDYEGNPIAGQIRFTMTDVLRDSIDRQLVAPSTIVVPLVLGAFTITLPATNDPDIVPNPFLYQVEESFVGGRTYTVSVPYDTVGSLDLANISPDPAILTPSVQLTDQTTWNVLAGNITTENTNVIAASADFTALPSRTTTAQTSATSAAASATLATNNANGTIDALLLIGG